MYTLHRYLPENDFQILVVLCLDTYFKNHKIQYLCHLYSVIISALQVQSNLAGLLEKYTELSLSTKSMFSRLEGIEENQGDIKSELADIKRMLEENQNAQAERADKVVDAISDVNGLCFFIMFELCADILRFCNHAIALSCLKTPVYDPR